jgi:hypothetical protein
MAEITGDTKVAEPTRKAKGKPKAVTDFKFDVNQHLKESPEYVEFKNLRLDLKMEYGQIRKVDNDHVATLVKDMELNPPHEVTLTTWMEPGLCFASRISVTQIISPASLKHYVLDGQHKFRAVQEIRDKALANKSEIPKWASTFRCEVVKDDVDLTTRQTIAGRQQAKSANVMRQSLSNTLDWVRREWASEEARLAEASSQMTPTLAGCLDTVYGKTGRTPSVDGTMVY